MNDIQKIVNHIVQQCRILNEEDINPNTVLNDIDLNEYRGMGGHISYEIDDFRDTEAEDDD